jgi:hypothetical protein
MLILGTSAKIKTRQPKLGIALIKSDTAPQFEQPPNQDGLLAS